MPFLTTSCRLPLRKLRSWARPRRTGIGSELPECYVRTAGICGAPAGSIQAAWTHQENLLPHFDVWRCAIQNRQCLDRQSQPRGGLSRGANLSAVRALHRDIRAKFHSAKQMLPSRCRLDVLPQVGFRWAGEANIALAIEPIVNVGNVFRMVPKVSNLRVRPCHITRAESRCTKTTSQTWAKCRRLASYLPRDVPHVRLEDRHLLLPLRHL